jgi:hypothetical protein
VPAVAALIGSIVGGGATAITTYYGPYESTQSQVRAQLAAELRQAKTKAYVDFYDMAKFALLNGTTCTVYDRTRSFTDKVTSAGLVCGDSTKVPDSTRQEWFAKLVAAAQMVQIYGSADSYHATQNVVEVVDEWFFYPIFGNKKYHDEFTVDFASSMKSFRLAMCRDVSLQIANCST